MRWLLASLSLLVVACSGDSGGSSSQTDGAPVVVVDGGDIDAVVAVDASTEPLPRIEGVACRYDVPESLGLIEGTGYECGDLVTVENRADSQGTVRIHYIRFFSPAGSANATIYFEGGPGGNGSGMVRRVGIFGSGYLDSLMVDGDFLVIAQRGTTLSVPSLDCDDQFSCSQLSTSLASYNTAYNADDVDDLRTQLGYQQLNLYGISYGSRLALEYMRRHGDSVRSSTIGGLVPAHVVWPAGIPASFYSSLTALDASCADDGGCGAAFGDLETDFLAGVNALNSDPVELDGGNIVLDGYSYAAVLFHLLYARSVYPWLPLLISDLATRRTDRVEDLLVQALYSTSSSNIAGGMYYSVVCNEMFSPPDLNAFDVANASVPADIRDIYGGSWYGLLDLCETWPTGDLQADLAEPVVSSIPSFVASGRLDPITPPSYGDAVADYLSDAQVVIYENSGHGSTVQSDCGLQTFLSFLSSASTGQDTSCAANLTTEYVLPGAAAGTPLDYKLMATQLRQALVTPELHAAVVKALKTK